ncbi:MAG: prepilin-type N-terminal cleavage/methylation domain-containing protein [Proteobacteria bacterium]|nr:prepilin-type N-terminal cleavage/methylation domain-containing protein [Pseudomonadota bacterium]
MTRVQAPARRAAGLTLVEVVVALAVLSLVVLALGASLRGLAQSATRVDDRVEAIDELRVGAAFLHEVFERTLPLRVAEGGRRLLFDGQPQAVAWAAVMPARFGAAGRFAFRLGLEPADDGSQSLVLRYAPLGVPAGRFPDWAQAEHRVLARRVETLSLGYGGEGLAAGWQAPWTELDRMPPRLRLDLSIAAMDWPPLVLSVRTPLPPGGRFTVGGGAQP